jgi:hypothetical protein
MVVANQTHRPLAARLAARGAGHAASRANSLAEVARRLSAEEPLTVVSEIDNVEKREPAAAEVARRLPAVEALCVGREIIDGVSTRSQFGQI